MWLRIIVLVVFIALDVLVITGKNIELRQRGAEPVNVDEIAPEFTWQDFDGHTHRFSDLKGKTIILHFWASWCQPCREEFPKLLKAANRMGSSVAILTISADMKPEQATRFIATARSQSGVASPSNMFYAFDPKRAITYDVFQSLVYPETILIDKKGVMRRKFAGMMNWDNPDVQNYLKQIE